MMSTIATMTIQSFSSPPKKSNKENTPPGPRPGLKKESSFVNPAAVSRQEPYKPRDPETQSIYNTQRGLSREDLDKLQKPAVKRLANVTQLCKFKDGIRHCELH
jgi:cell cycle protein kinase DBF2